ncbi:hypothetical protein A6J40_02075 [Legionella longbeachae]|uniref:hypothetical protein n=2 Tax=Legionella longbeachae TaxID=450 RepID=UPI0009B72358|nr:hypothetical protein [Legionella longbeachae]ARB91045.1 hypothetical protein A6J40_02075 [Legionella longbeachae]UAK45755.1 hypothetical protein K8O86_13290 [Legionella longbeachae]VEE02690.1 Uncharacterised protein [Legionella oakridgensis]
MSKDFLQDLRKSKIPSPTNPNFNLDEWQKHIDVYDLKDKKSLMIHSAGVIIYQQLLTIKKYYKELVSNNVNKNDLIPIQYIIGRVNKERIILENSFLSNNSYNFNSITSVNHINGSVSIIESAKFVLNYWLLPDMKYKKSNELVLDQQITLSSFQNVYENLWLGTLYGSLEFKIDNVKKKLLFLEKNNQKQLSSFIAQKRRLKRQLEQIFLCPKSLENITFKCLKIVINGRKQKYFISNNNNSEFLGNINLIYLNKLANLYEYFPTTLLKENVNDLSFTIEEILITLRHLVLMSYDLMNSFIKREILRNTLYAPKINKITLSTYLKRVTGLPFSKIIKIINFLQYDKCKNDLWAFPLVIDSNNIYLLFTPLMDIVLERAVERWLREMGKAQSDKGELYQYLIGKRIKDCLASSNFAEDSKVELCKKFSVNKKKEEIDLIIKFGNLILIGEIKSRLTTDSYPSLYFAFEALEGARNQVDRKTRFVRNNLGLFFSKFNWTYDPSTSYSVLPFVLTDNHAGLGAPIDNIPIIDIHILTHYFKNNYLSLISELSDINIPLVKLIFYKTKEEAYSNLYKYLLNPPQTNGLISLTERKIDEYDCLANHDYKFLLNYIAESVSSDPYDYVIKYNYGFEIETLPKSNTSI